MILVRKAIEHSEDMMLILGVIVVVELLRVRQLNVIAPEAICSPYQECN